MDDMLCTESDFANDALRFECKPQALLETVVFVHCSQEESQVEEPVFL